MRIRRSDEEVEIHREANQVCAAAGGLGDAGSGYVPLTLLQRATFYYRSMAKDQSVLLLLAQRQSHIQ